MFYCQRMVSSKVRDLNVYRQGMLSMEIRTVSNKNPGIQKYVRLVVYNAVW